MKIKKNKTYIIAEIGINHEGNIKNAIKLVKKAKNSGADAVKFQMFQPETLVNLNSRKTKDQNKTISKKETLYKMFKRVSLRTNDLIKLRRLSKNLKIDFICSVFDDESLKISKKLNLDAYKIASSDLTDINLIKKISKQNKPIVISTGMGSKTEIEKSLKILKKNKVYLLHCVSMYPCPKNFVNLKRMKSLKKICGAVGYSDHSQGNEASILAISMGAKILEKHFTMNKNRVGVDHMLSADPKDLKIICDFALNYKKILGDGDIEPSNNEKKMRKFFRKSIYSSREILSGEKISKFNIRTMRPQSHIKSEEYYNILGKKVKKNIKIYEPIKKNKIF
tara:strand:+ start:128 stop:1138 length:1011 start_codon:yes stop_codon:yes gene_type:complete